MHCVSIFLRFKGSFDSVYNNDNLRGKAEFSDTTPKERRWPGEEGRQRALHLGTG